METCCHRSGPLADLADQKRARNAPVIATKVPRSIGRCHRDGRPGGFEAGSRSSPRKFWPPVLNLPRHDGPPQPPAHPPRSGSRTRQAPSRSKAPPDYLGRQRPHVRSNDGQDRTYRPRNQQSSRRCCADSACRIPSEILVRDCRTHRCARALFYPASPARSLPRLRRYRSSRPPRRQSPPSSTPTRRQAG